MSIWWAVPAFVGLIGVLMLVGGLGRLFKLRFLSGTFRILFGGLSLAGAAVVGLIGLNLQTYARLTHEQLAAEITVEQTGPNAFTASVRKSDDKGLLKDAQEFAVTGDKVRLEGRVWKLKPWANVIGEDSFYRFERLQGRWDDSAMEANAPPTAYDTIADDQGIDVFGLPLGAYNPIQLDTTFGSGVYVPMVDGAIYEVMMTQSAFIARGRNEVAIDALNTWSSTTGRRQPTAPPPVVQQPTEIPQSIIPPAQQ